MLEKFSSVNFFYPPKFGGWNVLILLSAVLIIVWLGVYFYYLQNGRSKKDFIKSAWWLLLLAWLPVALISWFSFCKIFSIVAVQTNQTPEIKRQVRICALDANQDLDNWLCSISKYIAIVKQEVKPGSRLCYFVHENTRPFFNFAFYDDYDLPVDCQKADYLFVYLTQDKISYRNDGHLILTSNSESKPETSLDLGVFEAPKTLGEGIFLLKKVK